MQTIILANEKTKISTLDRGLNYGDGFFTTAKIINQHIEHWSYHKARLIECAKRLGFPDITFFDLEQQIDKHIHSKQYGVLKVLVTRGKGGRGYSLPNDCHLTIVISVLEMPSHYSTLAKKGLDLGVSPIKLAAQPLLAGLKTLNRLEQVLIKNELRSQNCDDVLVCDYNNHVIESSAANIFAIKGRSIFTPKLDECGIKGVYLQSLCDKLPIEFRHVSIDELKNADAVFICNSLMGAVPVKRLDKCTFDVEHSNTLLTLFLAKEAKC